ncbi:hypothetical protein LSAT2_027986 [Lamellibrachia satsuma]|nr:hypothetical protein LSAT2_027986 [Lamellibrachia satsuma]
MNTHAHLTPASPQFLARDGGGVASPHRPPRYSLQRPIDFNTDDRDLSLYSSYPRIHRDTVGAGMEGPNGAVGPRCTGTPVSLVEVTVSCR